MFVVNASDEVLLCQRIAHAGSSVETPDLVQLHALQGSLLEADGRIVVGRESGAERESANPDREPQSTKQNAQLCENGDHSFHRSVLLFRFATGRLNERARGVIHHGHQLCIPINFGKSGGSSSSTFANDDKHNTETVSLFTDTIDRNPLPI